MANTKRKEFQGKQIRRCLKCKKKFRAAENYRLCEECRDRATKVNRSMNA